MGKAASDLQSDVDVLDGSITGTLKYVTGYTGYSESPELQVGNFIALHAEVTNVEGATITVTMTRTATLEDDGNVVARVADKDTQTLTFTATKEGYPDNVQTFDLSELVCLTE